MCGRGRCTLQPKEVARACMLGEPDAGELAAADLDKYRPSYNISPGAYLPVVAKQKVAGDEHGEGERIPVLHCMKWGLVPSFTKKTEKPDHYRMFNARSESIREKASFRRLIPNNRCLVAMEGFYEWKKDGSKKQPYYIYLKDGRPLVFAALYDSWHNAEGELVYTFSILTTSSSSALQWLHDRMPVILGNKSSIDTWLNGSTSELDSITCPYEGLDLVWHPVTAAMGKPSFDGPECIKELQVKLPEKGSLSKFFKKPVPAGHEIKFPQAAKSAKERPCAKDVKKEKDETTGTEVPQPKVKDERETLPTFQPKEELEEYDIKKRAHTDSTLPANKQRKIAKDAGGEQATLFSYFGRS